MTVDLNQLVPFLVAACALIAALAAGLRWIKRWIREVAAPVEKAARQLQTSNGTTVAGYVEGSAKQLDRIVDELNEQKKRSIENRDIATSALTLANNAHARLDQHLINEHGAHTVPRDPEET